MSTPIFLFTDFGTADCYVGQVKAALLTCAPLSPVVDLINDAPAFDVRAAAHLLAALVSYLPVPAVTVAVVDPGVGSERKGVALMADQRWYVGPDNGLLSIVAARAQHCRCYGLDWLPVPARPSFHGRDLFAPAAGRVAQWNNGALAAMRTAALEIDFGGADHAAIIYVDHYGNAMTGIRAATVERAARVRVAGHLLPFRRVFAAAAPGESFWYENSIGLLEIASNQRSAAAVLGLRIGDAVAMQSPAEAP